MPEEDYTLLECLPPPHRPWHVRLRFQLDTWLWSVGAILTLLWWSCRDGFLDAWRIFFDPSEPGRQKWVTLRPIVTIYLLGVLVMVFGSGLTVLNWVEHGFTWGNLLVLVLILGTWGLALCCLFLVLRAINRICDGW